MSEMVKRVARAISAIGDDWTAYEDDARRAIAAMREPTEAMTENAAKDISIFTTIDDAANVVWSRMIDAALGQENKP